jgi:hypothetical protein
MIIVCTIQSRRMTLTYRALTPYFSVQIFDDVCKIALKYGYQNLVVVRVYICVLNFHHIFLQIQLSREIGTHIASYLTN